MYNTHRPFKINNTCKGTYAGEVTAPTVGIAVDASCTGGNPAQVECRGVDLATGEIVFSEQVGLATNNIGEILAIAYGASYVTEKNLNIPVYSDSKICINWYYQKQIRTNIFRDYPHLAVQNKNLVGILEECLEIIKTCDVKVIWWNKYRFGENVADYGRKNIFTR